MNIQVKDLVCGMMVNPETAPAQSEYEGTTYYFCGPGCKVAFDKELGRYLQQQHDHMHKHNHQ